MTAFVAGCVTEYHGHDSDIDDVLWRQIAAFEDPLTRNIYKPPNETDDFRDEPTRYLEQIDGDHWDGTASSFAQLRMGAGGVVLYDVSSTDSTARFSIFIASGPRADAPADDGRD